MSHKRYHQLLTCAVDFTKARQQVENFFGKSMLLRYDIVEIDASRSVQAVESDFFAVMENGIGENKRVLGELQQELKDSGFQSVDDIMLVKHGYQSKLFHIIAHLLDGFVGIDSVFYNLIEDSHWLSEELKDSIHSNPEAYWLIWVDGRFEDTGKASLIHS